LAFDILGDIAIVEDCVGAKDILAKHNNINVVLMKKSEVEGTYRIRDYEILKTREGERDFSDVPALLRPKKLTKTVHKENGCRLLVDPTEAYFSTRLSTERDRISKLVKDGESVLVMFAGVGPYPINIAKNTKAGTILGVELNPNAVLLFEDNIELNKLRGQVKAYEGDVRDIVPKLEGTFDRIIMPLPKDAETFLYLAKKKIRSGGTIHLYKICHENDLPEFLKDVKKTIPRSDITVIKAGEYAPGAFRYCLDITTDARAPRKKTDPFKD